MDDVKKFERENRYIVIKRSDLTKVPVAYRSHLVDPMLSLLSHLPHRECVVIESDWPEYNFVWLMLEHRMGGHPVPDFNAVKCAADVAVAESQLAALREELEKQTYKAELYDEVWGKATGMGFMNVTMALEELTKSRQRLEDAERRNESVDIEGAAQKLAACMDYPWEHMPEQGRASMREHAKSVIDAALNKPEEDKS